MYILSWADDKCISSGGWGKDLEKPNTVAIKDKIWWVPKQNLNNNMLTWQRLRMGAGRLRCHSSSHFWSSVWLYTSSSFQIRGFIEDCLRVEQQHITLSGTPAAPFISVSGFVRARTGYLTIGAQQQFLLPREVDVCHTDASGRVIPGIPASVFPEI